MKPRHFLDLADFSDAEIEALLARSCQLAAGAGPARLQATIANLFYEPSTRTRVSFELAARRLGMTVANIELEQSSARKGETLEDTVATLGAMGVEAVVLRHPEDHRAERLAAAINGPKLINAGDGTNAHPSQALLDAATVRARGIDFAGLKLAIIGDIAHSRVARSTLQLWPRLGVAEIRLAGPAGMLPSLAPDPLVSLHHKLADAVRGADLVMMLRVQHERINRAGWPDRESYFSEWGLKEAVLAYAAPNCLVMHPGPINRGMEIDPDLADGPRSLILDQVRMGVFARMAIFEWLLR